MTLGRDEFDAIAGAEELNITTRRSDGTLRPWTPIWVVRVGDDLYIRSYRGREGGCYRNATRNNAARIRAGGIETDVAVEAVADAATNAEVDAAYRAKYRGYSRTSLDPMVAATAAETTRRLVSQRSD